MPRTMPWDQLDRLYDHAAGLLTKGVSAPGSTSSWSAAALIEDAAHSPGAFSPGLADEALARFAGYLILTGEITHTDRWLQPHELVRWWERECDPDPLRIIKALHGAGQFAHEQRIREIALDPMIEARRQFEAGQHAERPS
jgi:hypothetical protein